MKIIEKYTKYTLHTYQIFNGNEVIALIPLFVQKFLIFNIVFSPPPRSGVPYLGIILSKNYYQLSQGKKDSWLDMIITELMNVIDIFSPIYVSLSLVPNFMDTRGFKDKNYEVIPNYTYILNINQNIQKNWMSLKKSLRKEIKKTEKAGIVCVPQNDVNILHDQLKKRYENKRINLPIMDGNYLHSIYQPLKLPQKTSN